MEKIWYSSYAPGVPETIDPDSFGSINELFVKYCKDHANFKSFTNLGVSLTYHELEQKVYALATYLQQGLGLKKGDRVAIMMPNLLQYPVAVFGILLAGLTVVNINPLYTSRELKYQLNDSGAKAVIIIANFAHTLEVIVNETSVKSVIISEIGGLLGSIKGPIVNFIVKHIKKMVPQYDLENSITFKRALIEGKEMIFEPVNVGGDDIAFLQYTGGTTGISKGAMLTHRNMVANVLQSMSFVKYMVKPGEDIVVGGIAVLSHFCVDYLLHEFYGARIRMCNDN